MHRTPALLTLITCSTALGACMGMSPLTESERQKMESLRHTQKEIPALCVIELEAQSGRVSSGQRSMQQSAMTWHMRSQHFAADALSPFGRLRCSGLDRSSRVRNSEQY